VHRVYGIIMFLLGIGFLLFGGYLLYIECISQLLEWQRLLLAAGVCLFGYLLSVAGYRMSGGERL